MLRRVRLGVLLCLLLAGCRDAATLVSVQSRSPDGRWVATAVTRQYGGPGTAGIVSTVSLQQVTGSQEQIRILQLSQNAVSVDLRMNWLTPAYLEITYRQPATVDFQAIKCGGVTISAEDVSKNRP